MMSQAKTAFRIAAMLVAALFLSGCVIVPAGPGYYHPHRAYYGWGY